MTKHRPRRFSLAHIIRRLSVPIQLFWLALGAITNVLVPPLEDVGNAHTVSLSPETAPSLQATKRIGHVFQDYARYVIDCNSHSADVQQATRDEMHWFYVQTPEQSRAYSEELATNFADPLTVAWPNHAKLFFNNKGVAAHTSDACPGYPLDDPSVWSW